MQSIKYSTNWQATPEGETATERNQRLLDEPCYQVGLISSDDIKAMGSSLKKTYEALKNYGDLNEIKLEDSAWNFMALDSIFGLIESRETRGDRRVMIAGNTGLRRD